MPKFYKEVAKVTEIAPTTFSLLNEKWDKRFLHLAKHVSLWSKDPSTKVGAVLVRPDRTVAGMGYNGFKHGENDSEYLYNDRGYKILNIQHAEINAINFSGDECMEDYCLYTYPFMPCNVCADSVIEKNIGRVVSIESNIERWKTSFNESKGKFERQKIELKLYPENFMDD